MALVGRVKITELPPAVLPLDGSELFETVQDGESRKVGLLDAFPMLDYGYLTVNSQGALPNSRKLVAGANIALIDAGPGTTLTIVGTGLPVTTPTFLVLSLDGVFPNERVLTAGTGVAFVDTGPAGTLTINFNFAAPQVFTAVGTNLNPTVLLSSTNPNLGFFETDAAANNGRWDIVPVGEQLRVRAITDAGVATDAIEIDRTAGVIDLINLLGTLVSVNGQSIRDAAILTSGTVATARLGSGTANNTSFLRGDQTWQLITSIFGGFANPTAVVGLAAVNGAATTAMRSDGAPALDQGIVPTWTGLHTFTANILNSSANPINRYNETDAAANNRVWQRSINGEQLLEQVGNDALSAFVTWLAVDRTLNVVDSIAFTATTMTLNGNVIPTGLANPTGTIGLAAVNGVATTALRSDGAPALSQAIAPTWTATHIFSNATTALQLSSATPIQVYTATGQAADLKSWKSQVAGLVYSIATLTDALGAGKQGFSITRGATTVIAGVAIGNATDQPLLSVFGNITATFASSSLYADWKFQNTTSGTGSGSQIRAVNDSGVGSYVGISSSASTGAVWVNGPLYAAFLGTTGAIPVSIGANNTERVRIASAGNVTINDPGSGITLSLAGNQELLRLTTTTARGSGNNYLQYLDPTGVKGYVGFASGGNDNMYVFNALTASILLGTSSLTRVTIASNGRVAIATPDAGASTTLIVDGLDNSYTAIFTGGATGSQSYGPSISAGTNSADVTLQVTARAGTGYFQVRGDGAIFFPAIGTTGSAGNAFLNSGSTPANSLSRSTSSMRYKTEVEDITEERINSIMALRPIWFRSNPDTTIDRPDWSWYGFSAEDTAQIDPRLVHWTRKDKDSDELIPDGVQYERVAVLLHGVVKKLMARIDSLETKLH